MMLWWTLRQLDSPDPVRRIKAAAKLGDDREIKAVASLLAHLSDARMTSTILKSLEKIAASGSIEPLEQGEIDPLREALAPRSSPLAGRIAHLFVALGGRPQNAAEAVRVSLLTKNPAFAAKFGTEATEILIEGLGSSDADERETAIETLAEIKDARAIEPLVDLIKRKSDVWPAFAALERIGDKRAIEPLRSLILDENEFGAREAARVFMHLGGSPRKADEAVKIALATGDHAIAVAFGAEAVDLLVESLPNSQHEAKRTAIRALGEIGDPRAVDQLVGLLQDWDPSEAILSLGMIGDPRAIMPLIALLATFRGQESVPDERLEAALSAVSVLQQFLEKRIEAIPGEALQVIACLPDVELTKLVVAPWGEAMANERRSLDLSHLRRTATDELLRRTGETETSDLPSSP